jgi:ribulose 1,5-bisphosphate synthetase/thiazole synthase
MQRFLFLLFPIYLCLPLIASHIADEGRSAEVELVSEQVIIIGGGASASSLARGLSDSGVRTLVIEAGKSNGAAHEGGVAERIAEWARAAATSNEVSVNYQTEPQRSLGGRRYS